MNKINRVTTITAQGVSTHTVGSNGVIKIEIVPIHFQGDPYDHYVGYNGAGNKLFSISCIAPTEVIYA